MLNDFKSLSIFKTLKWKPFSDDLEKRKYLKAENLRELVQDDREFTLKIGWNIYCTKVFHLVLDTFQYFELG